MMIVETPPTEPRNADTATIQRRYNRQSAIFDLREWPMELLFRRWRRRLWEKIAAGDRVLEVGVGTGKNMRFHPTTVDIGAIDFSPGMLAHAIQRPNPAGSWFGLMDAQHLAIADGAFDTAIATFVFCSVPDAVAGLAEVRRVLRPGGRLLLLEHVRSGLPVLGRCMDLLNPLSLRLDGVNINRNTIDNVRAAGFRVVEEQNLFLDIFKMVVAEPNAPAS